MHCLEQLHCLEGITVHLIFYHDEQNGGIIGFALVVSAFSTMSPLLFAIC